MILLKTLLKKSQICNTAEGIIAFYTDALDSLAGKEIAQILEINDLKSFEKIKDEILKEYYK